MIAFFASSILHHVTPYQEIFSASELRSLKYLLYVFIGILLLFGIFFYFASRKKTNKLPQNVSSNQRKQDFKHDLKLLYDFHEAKGLRREGCHKISAIMRLFLETVYKKDVEEMTVLEIQKNLQDRYIHEVMKQLSTYQFQKSDTTSDEFRKIYLRSCELVDHIVKTRKLK